MTRIAGSSAAVPPPAGPYSQSARIGPFVASSGQAGFLPDGSLPDDVAEQTRLALAHVRDALQASGAGFEQVLHMRIYLTDPSQFATMNEVYTEFLGAPYPARTTVYVTLPEGMYVEIDALAVV
ncbi:RidA family protein [Microbacterium sp. W4I20]|jgi:2-iminobutanoate/2-iminopropanoate deaminase|uniref:RidA family protein n=1 Tax=Microbacterium sp. W4I20 TaxID=3042262 RepID=UPI00278304A1|nr:RidA family protein [Microbacterium sp. W4I20]MDQ0727609.1 2-iminobutanoate/2-iminopropanoate deaminase [Microbacterium sp. W4I20]